MANPYRTKISIDPADVSGTNVDFPVLLTRGSFAANADMMFDPADTNRSAGVEQQYFDEDGTTETSRGIVDFSLDSVEGADDGTFEAWVVKPLLDAADIDPFLYCDFGDRTRPDYAPTDTYGRNTVWTGYFFATTDGGVTDSSGNLTMTPTGAPSDVAAKWGTGKAFTATENYLSDTVTGFATNDPITMSAWVNPPTTGSSAKRTIVGFADQSTTNQQLYALTAESLTAPEVVARSLNVSSTDTITTATLTSGTWGYATARFESSVTSAFVNGGNKITGTYTNPSGLDRVGVATSSDSTPFMGAAKDIGFGYVYDGARSDDWITTEYKNQNDPATFATAETPVVIGGFQPAWAINANGIIQ